MDVVLRIDLNLISAVMLSAVFAIAYQRLDRKDTLNKAYLVLSVVVFFQLLIEAATCVINKRPEPYLIPVANILHILLFGIAPILSYCWYLMVSNLIKPEKVFLKKHNVLFFIPVLVNTILTLLSPVQQYVFYISENNVYHRGKFYILAAAITYSYLILGTIKVFINKKRIIKQEYWLLALFSFLPALGGLIQSLFYGTLFMWSGTAFSLIIAYIFLEQRMVHKDSLTGAWNRVSFDYYIAGRLNDRFGVIYIDFDDLKLINDHFGHSEGDKALKALVQVVKSAVYIKNIVVRMGGDEFLLVLECFTQADLDGIISKIQEAIDRYNAGTDKGYQLKCSYGASIYNSSYTSFEQFMNYVDNLMYSNKRTKKL